MKKLFVFVLMLSFASQSFSQTFQPKFDERFEVLSIFHYLVNNNEKCDKNFVDYYKSIDEFFPDFQNRLASASMKNFLHCTVEVPYRGDLTEKDFLATQELLFARKLNLKDYMILTTIHTSDIDARVGWCFVVEWYKTYWVKYKSEALRFLENYPMWEEQSMSHSLDIMLQTFYKDLNCKKFIEKNKRFYKLLEKNARSYTKEELEKHFNVKLENPNVCVSAFNCGESVLIEEYDVKGNKTEHIILSVNGL